jgi:hypothetical protein
MNEFKLNPKKFLCILLIGLFYHAVGQSQSKSPGGVEGEAFWFHPGHLPNDAYLANFNSIGPKVNIGFAPDSIVDLIGHSGQTIFTVFQKNEKCDEQILWSVISDHNEIDSVSPVLLTTHRVADLEKAEYMNFGQIEDSKLTLNTYLRKSHSKPQEGSGGQFLIGNNISNIQVPASPFDGELPELIIYPRALSARQIIQVESYLALKYGISLNQPVFTEYLNSRGDVIWSNQKTPEYTFRITGIGRDNKTGLNQKQSTAATAPGQFVLSAGQIAETNELNKSILENESFLIWSDNNAPISASFLELGSFEISNRKWQVQRFGNMQEIPFYTRFRRNDILMHPEENKLFWLVIDDSGKGDFSPGNVSFFPARALEERGYVHFDSLYFDTNFSGQDVFSIGTAPDFFIYSDQNAPTCGNNDGITDLKIVGGVAPFRIELIKNEKETVFEEHSLQEDILQITGLNVAKYDLIIHDRSGKMLAHHFVLSHSNGPIIDLKSAYEMNDREQLVLDASHFSHSPSARYHWTIPDGSQIEKSKIKILIPGLYIIRIDDEDCTSIHQVMVTQAGKTRFMQINAFPNPTINGKIFMHLMMEEAADVRCSIFDSQGQLVDQSIIERAFDKVVPLHLNGPAGSYVIQLQSGQFSYSLKIIKQ